MPDDRQVVFGRLTFTPESAHALADVLKSPGFAHYERIVKALLDDETAALRNPETTDVQMRQAQGACNHNEECIQTIKPEFLKVVADYDRDHSEKEQEGG